MAIGQVVLALIAGYANNQGVEFSGSTATISGINYWIPPDTFGNISDFRIEHKFRNYAVAAGGLLPFTVVHESFGNDSIYQTINHTFSRFKIEDDVWQEEFSKVLYILSKAGNDSRIENTLSFESIRNCCVLSVRDVVDDIQQLPEGPYFYSLRGLHRAYRLYSDFQVAFSESTYTNSKGQHRSLGTSTLAVPSRLYYKRSPEEPLAGIRLGVKDIFDMSGLKTSNGNRAWWSLYPKVNVTALPVQRLIDAGAIVIGKMKTAQFANGEFANSDWIDYQSPFNPRGDGYQDPHPSSSGPAVGIASYPWLDVALGSDTGGSIRGPARAQGLYALRPSHGLVPLTHTTPLAPELDTAALIVRDPILLHNTAMVLYGKTSGNDFKHYPCKILAAIRPANLSIDTTAALDGFMDGLKRFLRISHATEFNIDTTWRNSKPRIAPESLVGLLNTTYSTLIGQRQSSLVRDPFYADYAIKHDGRLPFINPVPLARWNYGTSLPPTAAADALKNKTIFSDWFQHRVLSPNTKSCSDSILVYVLSPRIVYRDTYRDPPTAPFGFPAGYWSVMSDTPDIVLTIGQTPYHSKITQHVEYLPITVNLMAAKGCDMMLLDLVIKLVDAGVVQNVTTGASALYDSQIVL